jgi:hypothetical protein
MPGSALGALSATAAAIGLAWIAIVLIALAVAGLIRQVRELRSVLIDGFGVGFLAGVAPAPLRPSAGRQDAIVLVVEPASADQELVDAFDRAVRGRGVATEAKLLVTEGVPGLRVPTGVASVIDRRAVEALRVPWYPALVHVGTGGAVLDAAPVGSIDTMAQLLGRFEAAGAAPASRRE